MPDTYTFELYFTGLCSFHLLPDGENPKSVRVLLVQAGQKGEPKGDPSHHHEVDHGDAHDHEHTNGSDDDHEHLPYLSVAVRNIIAIGGSPPWPEKVVPAPDGLDCALYNLTGKSVHLKSEEAQAFGVNVGRKDQTKPSNVKESRWFDWVTVLRALDPRVSILKPECMDAPAADGSGAFAAAVDIPFGELGTFELGRRGSQLFVFDFRQYDGQKAQSTAGKEDVASKPRCISDRMVLRAKNLKDPVLVQIDQDVFGIGPESLPASGIVKASVTNFRTTFRRERPPAIKDFTHYYDLVEWGDGFAPPRATMIIPWVTQAVNGGHTPSTGSCPPSNTPKSG